MLKQASAAVAQPCRELEQKLKNEPVLNSDETGWSNNGEKRYLWALVARNFVFLHLRNRRGGTVSLNGLSTLLNNPFYVGVIRLMSTGETFQGVHEPLIGKSLFDCVHLVMQGKVAARSRCTIFRSGVS